MEKRDRTFNSETRRLENLKNGSLARANALGYVHAIIELGIPEEQIEDKDLYERGLAEMEYTKQKKKNKLKNLEEISRSEIILTESKIKDINYNKFYSFGNVLYQRDDTRSTDEQRRLLLEYFPYKFGDRGKIPISDASSSKVNAIFNSMIKYCKKKYNSD